MLALFILQVFIERNIVIIRFYRTTKVNGLTINVILIIKKKTKKNIGVLKSILKQDLIISQDFA